MSTPKPSAPPPPPPPPQMAKAPQAQAVRASVSANNVAQGGGEMRSSLLTGGMGDAILKKTLDKKSLLGG